MRRLVWTGLRDIRVLALHRYAVERKRGLWMKGENGAAVSVYSVHGTTTWWVLRNQMIEPTEISLVATQGYQDVTCIIVVYGLKRGMCCFS